ncbi:MAG: CapA family protein [Candidatus Kaiserbacteria bacterium]|nr:CapA family protein [Candidatus Kaiserbacteria bacterium]
MHTIATLLSALMLFVGGIADSFARTADFIAAPLSPPEHREATIIFGGDMMFDRSIRVAAEQNGGDYLFSCLDPVLKSADLVIANLEGPITDHASVSVGSAVGASDNFTFTFPTSTAPLLLAHNIRIVNLGNNHITNFRDSGVESTVQYLAGSGVGFFGDPIAQRVATTTVNGIRLAFINYNQFSQSSTAAKTIEQIAAARDAGYLPIVYTHWGEEYKPATDSEKSLAHRFVDAGAEMVIGSHPHVVQEHEDYRGKYIYYSLGNLIFDQYWDDAVTHGLLLTVIVDGSGVKGVAERGVELERDRRTCPLE